MSEQIKDGGARLAQMLTEALGPSHPAIDDLATLILSATDADRYRTLRGLLYREWFQVGEAEIGMRVYGSCPSEEEIDQAIDARRRQQ